MRDFSITCCANTAQYARYDNALGELSKVLSEVRKNEEHYLSEIEHWRQNCRNWKIRCDSEVSKKRSLQKRLLPHLAGLRAASEDVASAPPHLRTSTTRGAVVAANDASAEGLEKAEGAGVYKQTSLKSALEATALAFASSLGGVQVSSPRHKGGEGNIAGARPNGIPPHRRDDASSPAAESPFAALSGEGGVEAPDGPRDPVTGAGAETSGCQGEKKGTSDNDDSYSWSKRVELLSILLSYTLLSSAVKRHFSEEGGAPSASSQQQQTARERLAPSPSRRSSNHHIEARDAGQQPRELLFLDPAALEGKSKSMRPGRSKSHVDVRTLAKTAASSDSMALDSTSQVNSTAGQVKKNKFASSTSLSSVSSATSSFSGPNSCPARQSPLSLPTNFASPISASQPSNAGFLLTTAKTLSIVAKFSGGLPSSPVPTTVLATGQYSPTPVCPMAQEPGAGASLSTAHVSAAGFSVSGFATGSVPATVVSGGASPITTAPQGNVLLAGGGVSSLPRFHPPLALIDTSGSNSVGISAAAALSASIAQHWAREAQSQQQMRNGWLSSGPSTGSTGGASTAPNLQVMVPSVRPGSGSGTIAGLGSSGTTGGGGGGSSGSAPQGLSRPLNSFCSTPTSVVNSPGPVTRSGSKKSKSPTAAVSSDVPSLESSFAVMKHVASCNAQVAGDGLGLGLRNGGGGASNGGAPPASRGKALYTSIGGRSSVSGGGTANAGYKLVAHVCCGGGSAPLVRDGSGNTSLFVEHQGGSGTSSCPSFIASSGPDTPQARQPMLHSSSCVNMPLSASASSAAIFGDRGAETLSHSPMDGRTRLGGVITSSPPSFAEPKAGSESRQVMEPSDDDERAGGNGSATLNVQRPIDVVLSATELAIGPAEGVLLHGVTAQQSNGEPPTIHNEAVPEAVSYYSDASAPSISEAAMTAVTAAEGQEKEEAVPDASAAITAENETMSQSGPQQTQETPDGPRGGREEDVLDNTVATPERLASLLKEQLSRSWGEKVAAGETRGVAGEEGEERTVDTDTDSDADSDADVSVRGVRGSPLPKGADGFLQLPTGASDGESIREPSGSRTQRLAPNHSVSSSAIPMPGHSHHAAVGHSLSVISPSAARSAALTAAANPAAASVSSSYGGSQGSSSSLTAAALADLSRKRTTRCQEDATALAGCCSLLQAHRACLVQRRSSAPSTPMQQQPSTDFGALPPAVASSAAANAGPVPFSDPASVDAGGIESATTVPQVAGPGLSSAANGPAPPSAFSGWQPLASSALGGATGDAAFTPSPSHPGLPSASPTLVPSAQRRQRRPLGSALCMESAPRLGGGSPFLVRSGSEGVAAALAAAAASGIGLDSNYKDSDNLGHHHRRHPGGHHRHHSHHQSRQQQLAGEAWPGQLGHSHSYGSIHKGLARPLDRTGLSHVTPSQCTYSPKVLRSRAARRLSREQQQHEQSFFSSTTSRTSTSESLPGVAKPSLVDPKVLLFGSMVDSIRRFEGRKDRALLGGPFPFPSEVDNASSPPFTRPTADSSPAGFGFEGGAPALQRAGKSRVLEEEDQISLPPERKGAEVAASFGVTERLLDTVAGQGPKASAAAAAVSAPRASALMAAEAESSQVLPQDLSVAKVAAVSIPVPSSGIAPLGRRGASADATTTQGPITSQALFSNQGLPQDEAKGSREEQEQPIVAPGASEIIPPRDHDRGKQPVSLTPSGPGDGVPTGTAVSRAIPVPGAFDPKAELPSAASLAVASVESGVSEHVVVDDEVEASAVGDATLAAAAGDNSHQQSCAPYVALHWLTRPSTVLIVAKPTPATMRQVKDALGLLRSQGIARIFMEPKVHQLFAYGGHPSDSEDEDDHSRSSRCSNCSSKSSSSGGGGGGRDSRRSSGELYRCDGINSENETQSSLSLHERGKREGISENGEKGGGLSSPRLGHFPNGEVVSRRNGGGSYPGDSRDGDGDDGLTSAPEEEFAAAAEPREDSFFGADGGVIVVGDLLTWRTSKASVAGEDEAVSALKLQFPLASDDEQAMVPPFVCNSLDFVLVLGGDGTVLWTCHIFGGQGLPPLVAFHLGSLGFLTPFPPNRMDDVISRVVQGGFPIMLRHRLFCTIERAGDAGAAAATPRRSWVVLNEVVVDRGISPFLTNLECYSDGEFVTHVQGDGLIVATPTGSTAYSLAAGGCMVHPQVPCILFTPICPHSLSFRPLVFPDHVQLRVQVPVGSRAQMWASFDGKDRQQLFPGDAVVLRMSISPVPMVCGGAGASGDWFRGVREGLHWNLRRVQAGAGA